jgi:DNA-binding response OmpR family regulator
MKAKILIVDDNASVCFALKKFLVEQGHDVSTVLSGEEGIKKVAEIKPHIVFLDIKMPGMNGIEALKGIREINQEVGIIMMTAYDDDVGKKCIELGAYDFITKPLDLGYMEKVIKAKLAHFGA